jgi:hypothetical protein
VSRTVEEHDFKWQPRSRLEFSDGEIASHGEWSQETEDKIEGIFGGALPFYSIWHFARCLLDVVDDRAEVEEMSAKWYIYGGYDVYAAPPPPDMRPKAIEAAITVARDPVFVGLMKVRRDFYNEERRRKYGLVDRGSKRSPELDEFHAWVKGRKELAKKVDVETCDYWWQYTSVADPYGVWHAELAKGEDLEDCSGRAYWVASPDGDGGIEEGDLSDAQRQALHARIERNKKIGLGDGDLLDNGVTAQRESVAKEADRRGLPYRTPVGLTRVGMSISEEGRAELDRLAEERRATEQQVRQGLS